MQFFVPISFATTVLAIQEPKSATDNPTPSAPNGQNPAGTTAPGDPKAQPTGQATDPCGGGMVWMMLPMLALMYFMILRPEQKRKRQQQELMAAIKQGDHVVTVGGMHGIVARLTDKTVTIRVESAHLTFDRVAIARVERDDAGTPAKS